LPPVRLADRVRARRCYRLEQDGQLKAEWRPSENNRNAKYYTLTASGRRQLEQHKRRWERISFAISSVLEGA
jgi:DNA-binding PadR family transcriptional regulator